MDMQSIRGVSRTSTAAMIVAAFGWLFGGLPSRSARKTRKPFPVMVTSSRAEVAAHNAVAQRRIDRKRARLASQRVSRRTAEAFNSYGQAPKFPKDRQHKPHQHPLRDEHGAVTLVGKPYELDGLHPSSRELVLSGWVDGDDFGHTVQRKWLAGISAQRGC